MALQRVTRAVDRTLDEYVKRKRLGPHWAVAEKVAVCISASPQARDLIARGARLAEALGAELYVLHVNSKADRDDERGRSLENSLAFATHLGAQIVNLTGGDTARTTAAFIREHRITQAIVGRSATQGLRSYLYYYALQKFMAEAPHVDLHIVTQESH
jgi:two-component system sensor histidine kinase KdpD